VRLLRHALLVASAALLPAACASGPGVPGQEGTGFAPGSAAGTSSPDERPVLDLAGAKEPALPGDTEPRGVVPPGAGDPAVAEVDGVPVLASEIARFMFRFDSSRALDALNQVLDSRILDADAAARGITIPPEEITARTEQEVRAREAEIRVQYGPGVTLEAYLRERFGFTPESYRRDLGEVVRLQALRDRLVRFEASREERIRIRVLATGDEASAREAARRLREGADFTALARQVSLVPPAELPSYRREEIQPPELADELFGMEPGQVSRPVRVAREGKELFEVFKVAEKTPARDLPWPDLAREIEKGILERPVGLPEYVQWARKARERHGVKVRLDDPSAGGAK
jgi:hypothetical protein